MIQKRLSLLDHNTEKHKALKTMFTCIYAIFWFALLSNIHSIVLFCTGKLCLLSQLEIVLPDRQLEVIFVVCSSAVLFAQMLI